MQREAGIPILECDFQAQIIELAELYGWLVFSIPDSRRATCKGFPDLVLLHPQAHRFLVRELKMKGRRLSREQETWLSGLRACGLDTDVWYPCDWQRIMQILCHP